MEKIQQFHFPFQPKSGTHQMSGHLISGFFQYVFTDFFCLVCQPEHTLKPKTVKKERKKEMLAMQFHRAVSLFELSFLVHVTPPSQQQLLSLLTATFLCSCPPSWQIYSEESPVVISDALAGHLHQVQVRARDEVNSESQWSEWSPLLLVRPWEGLKESS